MRESEGEGKREEREILQREKKKSYEEYEEMREMKSVRTYVIKCQKHMSIFYVIG